MKNSYRIVPVTLCMVSAWLAIGCDQSSTSANPAPVAQAAPQKPATPAAPQAPAPAAPVQPPTKNQTVPTAPVAPPVLTDHDTGAPGKPPVPVSTVQHVKADPAEVDLGDIPTNDSKSGKVKLTNTSDQPVTVVSARPSCGCTALKFQPNTIIPPHESIEVDVQMTGGPRPGPLHGKIVTFVVEGQQEVVVNLKGQAVSFVVTDPVLLDPETMPEGKFTLKAIDNQPFKVMSVQPQVIDNLDTEAKVEHVLHVSWDKYREIGINRQMVIYLDHPKCQTVFMMINFKPEELATANKKMQEQANQNKKMLDPAQPSMVNPVPQEVPVDADTLLANMIKEGRNAEVFAKLQTGLDVNYRDNGGTPLIGMAAKAGNADLIKALIATNKVDINSTDNQGRTPLMFAATSKNADAVRVLLDAGASATTRDSLGATALWWAAMQGDGNNVKVLIEEGGADVEIVGSITGWTPLMVASGFGDAAAIEPLIKAHANIEAMDMLEGATPLIHAARTGKMDSLKALIKNGANLESADRNGNTAFLACAKTSGGEADKLKVLITAGANIKAKDNRGLNALELARKRTDIRAADVIAVLEPLLGAETPAAAAASTDGHDHAGHDHSH